MSTEPASYSSTAPLVLKLSTPLKTHRGEVRELELKPVTARAFTQFGTPFRDYTSGPRDNRESRTEFVWPAVLGFAAMATGIDEVTLSGIGADDMFPLANKIVELITRSPNE